ncbi:RNA-binding protein 23/39 [Sarotherodon galilaeus]
MHIPIVFAISCYMATFALSAPLPERRALVEGPEFQEIVQKCKLLTEKILLSIPETHKSCIKIETLQLNSTDNTRFEVLRSEIGIPSAPHIKAPSENVTLEDSLRQLYEGLQLYRALLGSLGNYHRLANKDRVTGLMADVKDLAIQIKEMLKIVLPQGSPHPTKPSVSLNLPAEYEFQVAAHLTLVDLQSYIQDLVRFLRTLDRSTEMDTES